jgi:starch phosphorylase
MADWLETARGARARQDGRLPVGRVPARPAARQRPLATDLTDIVEEAMASCGLDLATLRAQEVEPGLGNGGLGRLAACFIDSLATMDVSCIGYGIRYEYGIFRQTFVDGRQVEVPDTWLSLGAPWEFPNPERAVQVDFGGHTEEYVDESGRDPAPLGPRLERPGHPLQLHGPRLPQRRRQHAAAVERRGDRAFDLQIFNSGDYAEAVRAQTFAENISKVLYPRTPPRRAGSCACSSSTSSSPARSRTISRDAPAGLRPARLPEQIIFQLNDTHPVIAIPELMRLLARRARDGLGRGVGDHQKCFAYTCHTLLPEALEVWPTDLLGRLLPRHLEIIYRINEEFLDRGPRGLPGRRDAAPGGCRSSPTTRSGRSAWPPGHGGRDQGQRRRRAALPAAARQGAADFSEMWPEKFTNVTNGVTPRRFIRLANLASPVITDDHRRRLGHRPGSKLRELEPYAEDPEFRARSARPNAPTRSGSPSSCAPGRHRAARGPPSRRDGQAAARIQAADCSSSCTSSRPTSRSSPAASTPSQVTPRTSCSAPRRPRATSWPRRSSSLINGSPRHQRRPSGRKGACGGFPANYNVTLAEKLIPAADLSEQISLAGKEASGTGNMKFALNGALTIGTDDGANVEIRSSSGTTTSSSSA